MVRITASELAHTCNYTAGKVKDSWGAGAPAKVLKHAQVGALAGAGRPRNTSESVQAVASALGLKAGPYNARTIVTSHAKEQQTKWDDYT